MSVSLFEDLLSKDWLLEKNDNYWVVKEDAKETKNSILEIGGCRSIAFSLDKVGVDAFPFVKNNTTLKGVRSVCDGMVVAEINKSGVNQCVFIALDLKSDNISNAPQQIHSGNLLFSYLLGKMKFLKHTSIDGLDGRFIGVISCTGRKQPKKGTLTRRNQKYICFKSSHGDYNIVKLINEKKLNIPHLISQIIL